MRALVDCTTTARKPSTNPSSLITAERERACYRAGAKGANNIIKNRGKGNNNNNAADWVGVRSWGNTTRRPLWQQTGLDKFK